MPNAVLNSAMLVLVVALSLGCQRSAPTSLDAKPDQATEAAPVQTATSGNAESNLSYEPANDSEIDEFGKQVASAVVAQDIDHLDSLIDWWSIRVRSTETVDASAELKSLYLETVGSVSARPILNAWLSSVADGGSFRFLGARELDGQKSALFRITQPMGGLNYCDMLVGRSANGEKKCIDLRIFATGVYMSETFRHDFRLLVAKLEAGKATPEGEAYIKHVDELTEIARAVGNGDGVLACELIARLPSVLQADRRVLIMKIQAGMHLGGEVLLSAINEFSTRFPNDPATQLYSIQAYMLTGQHDAALRLLGELNESIGGDPYLDALRADVYFQKSDVETATRIATEVIEDEQGFDLAYWTLAKVAAMEARFADAVKWLDALHDVEGRMVDIEEALHEYSGFLDSAEFEMWRQRRLTGQRTNE